MSLEPTRREAESPGKTDAETLKRGREEMAKRCREVAEALVKEAGVLEVVYNSGTLAGHALPKTKKIKVPEPTTRRRLYIFAHECGHVALEHIRKVPRHREEYEAERWAQAALRRHGIAVPKKDQERGKRYVAWKITQAIRRGSKSIDREAFEWCEDFLPLDIKKKARSLLSRARSESRRTKKPAEPVASEPAASLSRESTLPTVREQLPAIVPAEKTAALVVPRAIADIGEKAAWRFIEFFTAEIPNDNTRAAYHRATLRFFAWMERRGLELSTVRPPHVAAYVKELGEKLKKPSVKLHLSAIRHLFDFLVVGQVIESNPAASVKGPKHSRGPNQGNARGKTPVLGKDEARRLLDRIAIMERDEETGELDPNRPLIVGLRDRALIALMVYSFARVGAALAMNVSDYYQSGKRWWVRLHEKGGKEHEMPAHHNLEKYLDEYVEKAGIAGDRNGPLFRTALGKTKKLSAHRLNRKDAFRMIRRRAKDAGVSEAIGCHTFRATGITNYLENGGTLEKAQQMAAHESAKTTKLYDRRNDQLTLDEVERIQI